MSDPLASLPPGDRLEDLVRLLVRHQEAFRGFLRRRVDDGELAEDTSAEFGTGRRAASDGAGRTRPPSIVTHGEHLRWTGRPAWSEYVFLWFFTAVFGVRAGLALWNGAWGMAGINSVGLALFVALAAFFRQTTRYTLTQDAVYKTKGLRGTSEQRLPLTEIQSVSVRQSALDRYLDIGAVVLHLKDGTSDRWAGVKHPGVIQGKIQALLR